MVSFISSIYSLRDEKSLLFENFLNLFLTFKRKTLDCSFLALKGLFLEL